MTTREMAPARMNSSMPSGKLKPMQALHVWLFTWEIYPILLIASLLRFYQINTTEFDGDQAVLFRMAHDAVVHGLFPVTSNIASINSTHLPLAIYLYMLPAALSENPLGGVILVAFLNVVAVLLTYIFVRRYFGRSAAIVAALFYATASKPIVFSRFIWQPNMVAPFIVLFFFPLFWGAVERRKGWLFPALLLLGVMVQLHETTILLAVPLLLAIVLAPETLRWRDLALGLLALLVLYFPSLLWEVSTKFADVNVLLNLSKLPSHIDTVVITNYRDFFTPYDTQARPNDPHTLLYPLAPLLLWLRRFMLIMVIGGFVAVLVSIVFSFVSSRTERQVVGTGEPVNDARKGKSTLWTHLWQWWNAFRASPDRCGLLLLLVWQVVPLIILLRHSETIYPHYLLLLLPGPFILIGLCIARLADAMNGIPTGRWWWKASRYALYAFVGLLLLVQLLGTGARIIDMTGGNSRHSYAFTTLNSLQDAVNGADQLARQHHLNHVYIASDQFTEDAFRYLAEQVRTPVTVFDAKQCLVLPNAADGPAALLVGPSDQLAMALLKHYATMTLIEQPTRLGGVPFQLYIVQGRQTSSAATLNQIFLQHLQLLDSHAQLLSYNHSSLLATRWQVLHSAPPAYRTLYNYAVTASPNGNGSAGQPVQSLCSATSLRAGEQLIVTFSLPQNGAMPMSLSIAATFYTVEPYDPTMGPLHLETIREQRMGMVVLGTGDGRGRIVVMAS